MYLQYVELGKDEECDHGSNWLVVLSVAKGKDDSDGQSWLQAVQKHTTGNMIPLELHRT